MNSAVPYGSNDQDEQSDYYTEYLENSAHDENANASNNNENSSDWTRLMYERSVTEKLSFAVQQKMNQPLQRNACQSKRNRDEGEIDAGVRDTMGNDLSTWNSCNNFTTLNTTMQSCNSNINSSSNKNNMQATYSNGNTKSNNNNTMPGTNQPAQHGPMKRKRTT